MPRRPSPDLLIDYKLSVPATLAGMVEVRLMDNVHRKAKYGARSALIKQLLTDWIARFDNIDLRRARVEKVIDTMLPNSADGGTWNSKIVDAIMEATSI